MTNKTQINNYLFSTVFFFFLQASFSQRNLILDPGDGTTTWYTWYFDGDSDGYGNLQNPLTTSSPIPPPNYVSNANDCNDSNPSIGLPRWWYRDRDGDGYGFITYNRIPIYNGSGNQLIDADGNFISNLNTIENSNAIKACEAPPGYVSNAYDCNDDNPNITYQTWYLDSDNDGFGNPNNFITSIEVGECRASLSGYVLNSTDCNDSNSNIYPVSWYLDYDNDGYGKTSDFIISCVPQTGRVTLSGDCDDNDPDINPGTIWYSDYDSDGFGDNYDSLIQCSQPVGYVLNNLDACPMENGGMSSSNGCRNLSDENYVYTKILKEPVSDINDINFAQSIESIVYYDDIGRPKQSIGIKHSPLQNSIVQHFEYDNFGRQTKDFLPVALNNNEAYFISNANIVTQNYYLANFSESNPYSEKRFENSPLGKVLEIGAPGAAWQIDVINDTDHTIKVGYEYNTNLDLVKNFGVTIDVLGNYILDDNSYYNENELLKNIVKNENWQPTQTHINDNTSVEFKDKLDRIILKRTYNNNIWHDTHYVYDDFGNLAFVLSPNINTQSGVITLSDLNKFAYQYKYDNKNRLVEKKMPGKDWEYIVYDKLNRPILTQDSKLKAQNKWYFTKYDIFDRVVYTGIWTNPIVGQSRIAVQNIVNGQSNPVWHEKKLVGQSNNINGTIVMYSNLSFPNVAANLEVLTIEYFDNYDFDIVGQNSEASYGVVPTSNVKALPTGSKTRVLGTNSWITSVVYYDEKARIIFTSSYNAYTGVLDKNKLKLDYLGLTLESENNHIKGGVTTTIRNFFSYDHVNRLLTHKHKINTLPEQLIVKNEYNEIGQLVKKNVGNSITSPLQEVDFDFNIRGWLTDINNIGRLENDLFNYKINYNEANTPYTNAGAPGSSLYNGNISSINWATNNSSTAVRSYYYKYDALNRLTDANYGENDIVTDKYNEAIGSYDKNGNFINLTRNSANPTIPSALSGVAIDDLTYTYDGNRLKAVHDNYGLSINGVEGFKDNNTVGDDYDYDINGNLIIDKNKGITSIEYNHLNLPIKIVFNNQDPSNATYPKAILYKYDAMGSKIEKSVLEPILVLGNPQNTITTTTYCGNFVYQNNNLQFFSHPEGYVAHNAGNFSYIYQYKDHLGNVRLTYSDANNDGQITGATSEVFYDGFENGAGWTSGAYWNTAAVVYDTSKKHSGSSSGKIENLTTSETIAHQTNWIPITITQPTDFIFSAWVYSDNPSAELFLFQNKATDQGYGYMNEHVATTQKNRWVYIEKKVTVMQDVTKLLLRLDNNGGGTVWFDDVNIRKVNSTNEIIEENNYYAFGLKHKFYNNIFNLGNANAIGQKYKYNGKELQDELGLNVTAMDYRQYDNALGRFNSIDPLAEIDFDKSPYAFGRNNPNYFNDPTGLCPECEDYYAQLGYEPSGGATFISSGGGEYHFDEISGEWYRNDGELADVEIIGTAKSKSDERDDMDGTEDDFSDLLADINTDLGFGSVAYGTLENTIANKYWWLDSKGKYNSTKQLAKGANGKYLKGFRGIAGKQMGYNSALNSVSKAKLAGNVLGYASAGISVARMANYYANGGTGSDVFIKASLDATMSIVGTLGPIGFGISATYFILDYATDGFGGYGKID